MRIRFKGSALKVRTVGDFTWAPGKGQSVVDVTNDQTLLELLTDPDEMFEIDKSEPMLDLPDLGPVTLGQLALQGVTTMEGLATLKKGDKERVSKELGYDINRVSGWSTSAQAQLKSATATPPATGAPATEASAPQEGK